MSESPSSLPSAITMETPTPEAPTQPEAKPMLNLKEITAFFRDLVVILVLVLVVRTYLVAPFQILGSSMETNYSNRDFILIDKFSYASALGMRVGNPERGDVVVLKPHVDNRKEYYLKRIIGLPGDTIRFEDGSVFITASGSTKEVKLSETYLSPANKDKTFLPVELSETAFEVPAGQYFVMGDNRNNSSDSRSCFLSCTMPDATHFVSRDNVTGKVWFHFGYFDLFQEGSFALWTLKWIHTPKGLGTIRQWTYPELTGIGK